MSEVAPRRHVMGYSDEDRARIRAGLHAYMTRHGIGNPRLLAKIEEATGRRSKNESWAELSLSSLQRFLKDKVRTDDALVHVYAQFISNMPEIEEQLSVGPAFAKFIISPSGATLPRQIAGDYVSPPKVNEARDLEGDSDEYIKSCAIITRAQDGTYALFEETIFEEPKTEEASFDPALPGQLYKGYGFPSSDKFIFFGKSTLTGTMRVIWLEQQSTSLTGRYIEPEFPPEKASVLARGGGSGPIRYERSK